ncbi:MAG TPA: hypothetical protein VMW76_01020 [Bacteroidales bacterium]|nr:hypothetical protein [Bacteroidales bacterium]
MKRRAQIIIYFLIVFSSFTYGQGFLWTRELVNNNNDFRSGRVEVNQDSRIDTLLNRHINANKQYNGFDGFRIQIYRGSDRDARESANEAKAKFLNEFTGMEAYLIFDPPNYFKVRVGDYRTKHDAYPDFITIRKKFSNAYIVTDKINFPDLEE